MPFADRLFSDNLAVVRAGNYGIIYIHAREHRNHGVNIVVSVLPL